MAWDTIDKKKGSKKRTTRSRLEWLHSLDQEPSSDASSHEQSENEVNMEKSKDLHSGMELLEMDFLLGVVENTVSGDSKDVTMRRLNFEELNRRGKLGQVDSHSLAVYAVNAGDLYGKEIQCAATQELAHRTNNGSKEDD